jgi:hydroxyacylglutathione hydrolase
MKMFLEKIHSEGLSHLSYIIGHGGRAAVIDPRRDCDIYPEIASRNGTAVTHIFETHRNEDYVIGSTELALKTGAEIYHGKAFEFDYGNPVSTGDAFEVGDLTLEVIETPGHTYESISIAVADRSFGDSPIAVFSGDALFSGDVGRTDFFPDKAEEVAGLLYDSIFGNLLPLGDHVILLPAHGAGSVCGRGMADREFTTLGYERLNNPILRHTDREKFIAHKISEHHYKPPYFKQMEKLNKEGSAKVPAAVRALVPCDADHFEKAMKNGMIALDIRSAEAFAGAFIPDSLAIPVDMVPAYAGWFLPYDRPVGIISDHFEDVQKAVRYLMRLGYDNIEGFLENGLTAWEVSGRDYDRIPAIHAAELVRRIQNAQDFTLLDVRKKEEVEAGRLPHSVHIFLGELPHRLDQVPKDLPVTTFCGSGQRAIIAASILKRYGLDEVEDSLGSMAACSVIGCPIVQ